MCLFAQYFNIVQVITIYCHKLTKIFTLAPTHRKIPAGKLMGDIIILSTRVHLLSKDVFMTVRDVFHS